VPARRDSAASGRLNNASRRIGYTGSRSSNCSRPRRPRGAAAVRGSAESRGGSPASGSSSVLSSRVSPCVSGLVRLSPAASGGLGQGKSSAVRPLLPPASRRHAQQQDRVEALSPLSEAWDFGGRGAAPAETARGPRGLRVDIVQDLGTSLPPPANGEEGAARALSPPGSAANSTRGSRIPGKSSKSSPGRLPMPPGRLLIPPARLPIPPGRLSTSPARLRTPPGRLPRRGK